MALTSQQTQYANWLVLDRPTKRHLGMPLTIKDWAEDHGISERTPRRWQQKAEFQEYLAQRKQDLAMSGAVTDIPEAGAEPAKDARRKRRYEEQAPPASVVDEVSEGRGQYEFVREQVYRLAVDGDSNATALWMKHWGQAFIEEERRLLEGRFPEMGDEELVETTLELIGVQRVAAWLRPRLRAADAND